MVRILYEQDCIIVDRLSLGFFAARCVQSFRSSQADDPDESHRLFHMSRNALVPGILAFLSIGQAGNRIQPLKYHPDIVY